MTEVKRRPALKMRCGLLSNWTLTERRVQPNSGFEVTRIECHWHLLSKFTCVKSIEPVRAKIKKCRMIGEAIRMP
jgi:hypothetical protein